MSVLGPPRPARLVIGVFTADRSAAPDLVATLTDRFGPLDLISQWIPFDQTDYYRAEMGGPLFRRLLGFARPFNQDALVDAKLICMDLEREWSLDDGRRRINIDPGYLVPSRFVLATGKDHTHRVYLGKSVYADLTLLYTKGGFQALPWTYPGYKTNAVQAFLNRLRMRMRFDAGLMTGIPDQPGHGPKDIS